jgi:4-amino-4-deoxy-L-arabinose transferase-like glycosyltransferase
MEEPSVLDYVKSRLSPWKKTSVRIPLEEPDLFQSTQETSIPTELTTRPHFNAPWKVFLALLFAIAGQRIFEPPAGFPPLGIVLYGASALFLLWAVITDKDMISSIPAEEAFGSMPIGLRERPFVISGILLLVAFVLFGLFGGNHFNLLNVAIWVTALVFLYRALWLPGEAPLSFLDRLKNFFRQPNWKVTITRWSILVVLVLCISAFFRFYRLSQVPGEMFSDHAEKLLDVNDLLHGQTKIFFERNTGREAIQFYLTAAIASIFGTGLSFISLKLGTALAGFLTLPFVYKLGKEIGNRWVGLFAMFMMGIAYWPNVISRIGLRFPLFPLFAAPALYFLIRGLRRGNRNDILLAGVAVGLGLQGYSPTRILPFVLTAAIGIYLIHKQSQGHRVQVVWAFVLLALVSFALFLPLFRYALSNPELFNYRALSRMTNLESPLPGPVLPIFLGNLGSALMMFFWNNGNIWVNSIPNRPALDVVTAALFSLGVLIVVVRYIRNRNWVDLFLLASIPLLMLPSILSLAFPNENPSLNRTGAAAIPVFIIAAIALDTILRNIKARLHPRWSGTIAVCVAGLLLITSSAQNFDLVFNQFDQRFLQGAWNTSEIGEIIRNFANTIGTRDSAYVIPYPYWVDTRLVGINAGYPTKDYALPPEEIKNTVSDQNTKMFILNLQDQNDVDELINLYPQGILSRYTSKLEGKDFLIYQVPGISIKQPFK